MKNLNDSLVTAAEKKRFGVRKNTFNTLIINFLIHILD